MGFRKRRRPEWPVLVYRYKAVPMWGVQQPDGHWDHRLPEPAWREAQSMRDTWNACIAQWQANRTAYEALLDEPRLQALRAQVESASAVSTHAMAALKEARQSYRRRTHLALEPLQAAASACHQALQDAKAEFNVYRTQRKIIIREAARPLLAALERDVYRTIQEAPIYWAHKLHLHDSVRLAVRAFLQGIRQPPRAKDGPLEHVFFQHHFMDGGLPIEHLFMPSSRFTFALVDDDAIRDLGIAQARRRRYGHATGVFRMGGTVDLPLCLCWDRLPPDGSYLKKLRLIGQRLAPPGLHKGHPVEARWVWSLQLTVEVPPETVAVDPAPAELPVAAIDLNWRVTDAGIRLGVLVDSSGHREDLYLPKRTSDAWRFLQERQADQAAALERAKDALKALDALPEAWRRSLSQAGRGALWRWRREVPDLPEAPSRLIDGILRGWAHVDTELQREHRGRWARLVRDRHHAYVQQAHDLCFRYKTVILEDMDLRRLAHDDDAKDPVLRQANKYRQLVSVSEWRGALGLVAPKYGTTIHRRNPAGTTATCGHLLDDGTLCGAPVEQTGHITLWCAAGHGRDQDQNAAEILLSRYLAEAGASADEMPNPQGALAAQKRLPGQGDLMGDTPQPRTPLDSRG